MRREGGGVQNTLKALPLGCSAARDAAARDISEHGTSGTARAGVKPSAEGTHEGRATVLGAERD